LTKDAGEYQRYTPQYKIGRSLKKESGSLIKYYKTGEQEDGYKGYSTNYQDLNIDVYKLELWKIVKDILRLLGYDIQKLEEQIFSTRVMDGGDMIAYKNNLTFVERRVRKHRRTETNVHSRNDSLTNYCLLLQQWRGLLNEI
jgi:hypothetical protein